MNNQYFDLNRRVWSMSLVTKMICKYLERKETRQFIKSIKIKGREATITVIIPPGYDSILDCLRKYNR